mgnify:CR=1 FL=1
MVSTGEVTESSTHCLVSDMGDMSARRREETRAKKLPEAGDDSEEDVKQGIVRTL